MNELELPGAQPEPSGPHLGAPCQWLLEAEEEVWLPCPCCGALCCPSWGSHVPAPQDSVGCAGAEPGSGSGPVFPMRDAAMAPVPLTGCPPAFLADVAFPAGVKWCIFDGMLSGEQM